MTDYTTLWIRLLISALCLNTYERGIWVHRKRPDDGPVCDLINLVASFLRSPRRCRSSSIHGVPSTLVYALKNRRLRMFRWTIRNIRIGESQYLCVTYFYTFNTLNWRNGVHALLIEENSVHSFLVHCRRWGDLQCVLFLTRMSSRQLYRGGTVQPAPVQPPKTLSFSTIHLGVPMARGRGESACRW